MNSFVAGIDLGEKENNAMHMEPDGGIKEGFNFFMNDERYTEFKEKISLERRIAFEASGSVLFFSTTDKSRK